MEKNISYLNQYITELTLRGYMQRLIIGRLTHQVQMFQQSISHCGHSLTTVTDQPV